MGKNVFPSKARGGCFLDHASLTDNDKYRNSAIIMRERNRFNCYPFNLVHDTAGTNVKFMRVINYLLLFLLAVEVLHLIISLFVHFILTYLAVSPMTVVISGLYDTECIL